MKIYLFTICRNDEISIIQIYATGRIRAKQSIIDLYGCEEKQINYQGQDTTTEPMNWGKFENC